MRSRAFTVLACIIASVLLPPAPSWAEGWKKHVVSTGDHTNTAVAADFTGDGKVDVISNGGGKTRLHVSPDWKEIILDPGKNHRFIHSEVFDVDRDGDPDYIGARYQPGLIVWFERPDNPLTERWPMHLIDDQVIGIHGLLRGDVDRDGRVDLLANSAQPKGRFPNSLVWFSIPEDPRKTWDRHVLAKGDAPGLSHYLGLGDVNGDGRPDVSSAAKGGSSATPGAGDWFAWWEAPKNSREAWKKHVLADDQPGATNIHPADVDGDGDVDFIASRGHARGVLWFEAPSWKIHDIQKTIEFPHCLVVADLNGDGHVDAATCAFGDELAVWFENDGKGKFKTHVVGRNQGAYDIRAVDMDGDKDLDLLIGGRHSKNVVFYENPLRP